MPSQLPPPLPPHCHDHHVHADHPLYAPPGHDAGLAHDLHTLGLQALRRQQNRRGALRVLGAGAALAAAGAARAATCTLIPEETAGPFRANGSNGMPGGGVANALMLSGVVRRDVRTSIGGATGTAAGIPLLVRLQLVNTNASCASLGGNAVYLWHCTRDGLYSMYSSGVTAQNFLRGVQISDRSGTVEFLTIVPGCYAGRMPHIHLEVYRSATTATSFSHRLRTTQMAFPRAFCESMYSQGAGYEASVINLSQISFATDNVFSDGYLTQLAAVNGERGIGADTATLQIGISV